MISNIRYNLLLGGIVAGIGALGLRFYYLFRKSSRDILNQIPTKDIKEFKQALNEIIIETDNGYYSPGTMTKVFLAIKAFLSPFWIEERKQNQIDRKNYLNDIEKYICIHEKHTERILTVWQEAADLALDILNIDKRKWANDIEHHVKNGIQQIIILTDYFPYSIDFLKSSIDDYPPIEGLKDILNYQIDFLNSDFKNLIPNLDSIKNFRDLRIIIRNRAFDFVYEKYELTPDHINYGLSMIKNKDQSLTKIIESFEYLLGETIAALEDLMISQNLQKNKNLNVLTNQNYN